MAQGISISEENLMIEKRQLFNTVSALKYSELKEKWSFPKLKQELRKFNLSSVIVALTQINTLIALKKVNPQDSSNLTDYLVDNYIDPAVRSHPIFIAARKAGHPVFGRQQLLTLIRLCALECSERATLLADGHTDGGYALGNCYLALADNFFTKKDEKAITSGSDSKRRRNLALQLGPQFELMIPQDLKRVMVRWEVMLSDVMSSSWFMGKVRGFDLAGQFQSAVKLGLQEYRDFIFSSILNYLALNLADVITCGHILKMHRSGYLRQSLISEDDYDRYLSIDSIKLSDLPHRLTEFADKLNLMPNVDFAVFRRWPLVELDTGYLFIWDPIFLVEKLGDGVRHTIRDSLALEADRKRASTAYGYLFEGYVDATLRRIYPREGTRLVSFPKFNKSKAQNNEAFDGVVVCPGGHLIVMEYKGGFLSAQAKYSGKMKTFQQDLDLKFGVGNGAGVRQRVTKIEKLFHADRSQRDSIPELEQYRQPETITPVLVVQETFLGQDFMTEILHSKFQRLLKTAKITEAVKIMPLQILDVDSLESMAPNLIAEDFRLEQVLNARAHMDPSLIANFSKLTKELFPSFATRDDAEVEARFISITERIRHKFWGDG
jgi:hypothetical protein